MSIPDVLDLVISPTTYLYKKVHVLIHNGTPICESHIIIEYIDETWPTSPPLLPNHPYDRYLERFWSDFLYQKLIEVLGPIFNGISAKHKTSVWKKGQDEFAQMAMTIEEWVAKMEQRALIYVQGKNSLGYMDVFFAPYVALFGPFDELFGLRLLVSEKCPKLHKWIFNFLTNEFVKVTLPDAVKIIKHIREAFGME